MPEPMQFTTIDSIALLATGLFRTELRDRLRKVLKFAASKLFTDSLLGHQFLNRLPLPAASQAEPKIFWPCFFMRLAIFFTVLINAISACPFV